MNVWLHDVSERMRIRRRAVARDAGLDESFDVGTYPEVPDEMNVRIDGGSTLRGALIGGLLLASGAGLAGVAANMAGMLGRDAIQQIVPEVQEPVDAVREVWGADADLEIVPPSDNPAGGR